MMCTRYYMELSPELRPIIEAAANASLAYKMVSQLGRPVKTEGEIRPTDIAPVIAPNAGGIRSVFPMIWGFTAPAYPNTRRSQPLVNCRVETAASKPTWAESWYRRRCIVPASYYFEWEHLLQPDGSKKTGSKYMIQPQGAAITWLAGLYRIEDGYPHFTILTRTPSQELARIHDRMPVILPVSSIDAWINPATSPETVSQIARDALTDMVLEKTG